MNNSYVFQKSDLGREKIKNKELDILPRQARTLLFLIDGEKRYDSYLESLEYSDIFSDTGGVSILFELLQDLHYIEIVTDDKAEFIKPNLLQDNESSSLSVKSKQNTQAVASSTTMNNDPNHIPKVEQLFYSNKLDTDFESKRSELASYIEQKVPGQDAWVYMLSLEKCDNAAQLQALVQDIQSSAHDDLAAGMQKFYEALER